MKLKIYLYHTTRISLGLLLVLYSIYNVIKYEMFLDKLDHYFNSVSIFDIGFMEATAPLVPFVEFIIGIFLVLDIFMRRTLIIAITSFGFFTLFLFDANSEVCGFIYMLLCFIAIVLLKNNRYGYKSKKYIKDLYQIIQ